MHYLIDGHNLIGRMPDISLDDPDDEVKLVLRLRRWTAASLKRVVTVYFDGGLPGGKDTQLSKGRITVIFAPSNRTADDLLIQRIQQLKNPKEYTLVSSDLKVVTTAVTRRVPCLTAVEFAETLTGYVAEEKSAPSPTQKQPQDHTLSESEVAEWLQLFGPVNLPARKPPPPPPPPPPAPPATPPQPITNAPPPPTTGKAQPDKKPPLLNAKRTTRKLSEDEVDEWMEIFKKGKG
jgi:uncharacterized protein